MKDKEVTMPHIAPYIGFNGKAEEALKFYSQVFGAVPEIQYVKDAPIEVDMDDDLVFHGAVLLDSQTLMMGSDMMGPGDEEFVRGNAMSLAVICNSADQLHAHFDMLAKDGTVVWPVGDSEWGSLYGQVKDKYGITWMLNYQ